MVVEVGPEIEQLVFQICRRPEQVIQILAPRSSGDNMPVLFSDGDTKISQAEYELLKLEDPLETQKQQLNRLMGRDVNTP